MRIKMHHLERRFQQHSQDIFDVLAQSCRDGQVVNGPMVSELQQRFAEHSQRSHAVALNSCSDALYLALLSLGIGAGDEVLVTSFSFVASLNAILRVGAVPVFIDIEPETHLMQTGDLSSFVSAKTKALLAVHMHGQMLDIKRLQEFCSSLSLYLIEDAAQAWGSRYGETKAGRCGDISCLSFGPNKPITGFGTGGMLLTNLSEAAARVAEWRNQGRRGPERKVQHVGLNSHMSEWTAAALLWSLNHHERWQQRRQQIATYYNEAFHSLPVQGPVIKDGAVSNWHKYVVQLPANQRGQMQAHLAEHGIETTINYQCPLFDEPIARHWCPADADRSVVRQVCSGVLSLPINPELTDLEVEEIVAAVQSFF